MSHNKKHAPRVVPHRAWNVNKGFIGEPETGKSTVASALAADYARSCYVLAHDLNFSIPDKLPTGRELEVHRHLLPEQAGASLSRPETSRGIHAIASSDAGEVIDLAYRVSLANLGGQKVPLNEELTRYHWTGTTRTEAVPVVVYVDELVNAIDATPYRLGDVAKDLLSQRRHRHVGLIWTTQSPRLVHYQFVSLCTSLVLFRVSQEDDLKALAKAGVPREILQQLPGLPLHHFIEWRKSGIVYDLPAPQFKTGNGKVFSLDNK